MSTWREDWPTHQPEAPEAPIPGRHWYGGCDPDRPKVGPDGICLGCGRRACPECGREACPDHPRPRHNPDAERLALLDRRWPDGRTIRESTDGIGRGTRQA